MKLFTSVACSFPRYMVKFPSITPSTSISFLSALVALIVVSLISGLAIPACVSFSYASNDIAGCGRLLPVSIIAFMCMLGVLGVLILM